MNNIINNKEYEAYINTTSNSKITFSEKRSSYVLNNKKRIRVYTLSIDGGVIKNGLRCDKGIYYAIDSAENRKRYLYLIELKGEDIEHAFRQLFETYKWFKDHISIDSYLIKIRVVCTKVCKSISLDMGKKKFVKKNITDIIVKEKNITDSVK